MEGRWLVWIEDLKDWQNVVPCDDAAIERAVDAAIEYDTAPDPEDHEWFRGLVEAVLRAAGETP